MKTLTNWYKSFLSKDAYLAALSERAGEWVTLTELTAMLSHCIPPEAAVRAFLSRASEEAARSTPLPEQVAIGKRTIVAKRSGAMKYHGLIEKCSQHRGIEPSFRLKDMTNGD